MALWFGPTLFVDHPITADDVQELGGQVLGGTVIAGAIFVAERLINDRIQQEHLRREEAREMQEELHEQLTLQRDLSDLDFSKYNARIAPQLILNDKDALRTIFSGANLKGAFFSNINFTSAKFAGTDLRRSQFPGCTLIDADFRKAKLQGANLQLVHPATAALQRMEDANFVGARYDTRTLWPQGFDPKAAGAILEEDSTP